MLAIVAAANAPRVSGTGTNVIDTGRDAATEHVRTTDRLPLNDPTLPVINQHRKVEVVPQETVRLLPPASLPSDNVWMSEGSPAIPRWGRNALACAAIVAVTLSIAGALAETKFAQIVHLKMLDQHFLWRGSRPVDNIVLIVIDQKSYDNIPDVQMFWHPYYAEAIRAAAKGGAKVMGLDIAFAVPVTKWEPGLDEALAAAVADTSSTMPVICGYVPSFANRQEQWPVPVNIIASALGQSAFVNLTIDADDFVRQQELVAAEPSPGETEPRRSLAMRVAEKYAGAEAVLQNGELTFAGRRVPVEDRRMRINYAGPPGTVPRISLYDFISAARAGRWDQVRTWVQGKALLMGVDTISDRHPTPYFTSFHGTRWSSAGVEIHANTVRTLVTGEFLATPPRSVQLLAPFLMALLTTGFLIFLPLRTAIVAMLSAIVAGTLAAHVVFVEGWVLPTAALQLSGAIPIPLALGYHFFTARKRSNLFKKAVSLFVGSRFAETLDLTEQITFAGSREVVTILFSDLRGFTAFCEDTDPSVIVTLLNEYLASMVAIIVGHGGQVNKFIGDGILAIFCGSDTKGSGNHAERAVQCGADMIRAKSRFKTGVGIHTGPVVLGNVGSADKLEYTALGDTVNIASRIEGLNKELGQSLLYSEDTSAMLSDPVRGEFVQSVQIRGRTTPLRVYTVPDRNSATLIERTTQAG